MATPTRSWIDRTIGRLAPQWELNRVRAANERGNRNKTAENAQQNLTSLHATILPSLNAHTKLQYHPSLPLNPEL